MDKEYKYSFRAKAGRDDLIIEWLENVTGDRSYYIREALRDYLTPVIPRGAISLPNSINSVKKLNIEEKQKPNVKVKPENNNTLTNLRSWID